MKRLIQKLLYSEEPRKVPEVSVKTTFNYYQSFTAPNPDINGTFYNLNGDKVATAIYAISPLNDRIYIFTIEVEVSYRRQRYGLAVLYFLSQNYGLPITAIKELYSSTLFWNAVRQDRAGVVNLTEQISVDDMGAEADRWRHRITSTGDNRPVNSVDC